MGARLAQGLDAAMTLPAALSILTTTFKEGKDRQTRGEQPQRAAPSVPEPERA
jgi:hypothetical protein